MKELIEKKNDLITRAEKVLAVAKEEKRELTPEEAQELKEIKAKVDMIAETIKLDEDVKEMAKEDMEKKEDYTPTEEGEKMKKEETNNVAEQETRAFENYIRGYVVNERAGELTKADNGAVIPTSIANKIIKKVYDICPILEQSTKYNVKGNLDLPYYDADTSNITVAYQSEFVAMSSSNSNFKSIRLTGFLAGALSKISRSLINNSQFNIVDFVVDEMANAIKRFIEKELLVGTPDKVEGLSTLTNKVETASATAITADEIIKLQDSIKDEFQSGAIWIMSSKTRTALRLLKDANERYLLQDDINATFGKTLLGKPVYVSDNMPEIGAGNTAIYYGDMKGLATKFNEEINVEVLREKYADEHAVGVIGWFEFDSKVEDAQKLAKLVCKSA
jgi:HK97 family phage major capsid protein